MPISYKNKIYTTLGTPTGLSGNVVSATDSAGVPAKDYTVKGKTIVWNQLLDKSKYPATTTKSGVTFTNNGDGTITANGTAAGNVWFEIILGTPLLLQIDHKMLLIGCPSGGGFSSGYLMRLSNSNDDTGNGKIFSANAENSRLFIFIKPDYTANNLVFKPQLFDLTQMFGAGNEPTTVAQFRAMFPDDYYPYNEGELKTIVPTSVEASGIERFQLLDKSKYPATTTTNGVTFTNNGDGTITVNGTAGSTVGIWHRLENDTEIPVGHKALISGGVTGAGWSSYLFYDDSDATYGIDSSGGGKIYTIKRSPVKPMIFVAKGYTVSNITFKPQLFDLTQMFGAGNEPATVAEFWQKVPDKLYGYNPNGYKAANIPSSKYFPDGMKSAGSVYDEINFLSQKAVKRIGAVDLGTLNWNSNSGQYPTNSFYSDILANAKKDTHNVVSNGKFYNLYISENGRAIAVTASTEAYNSSEAFKAAMSGVMLYYELATPAETEITPPLQALPTYKGFTSFSAPNSLTQNGPLSVTYYSEGGSSPEKGWLTSYKRKLYMGRNIEWNQLFTNSAKSSNGVTVSQNQDGTMTLNGTASDIYIGFTNLSDAMNQVHKYLLYLKILNNPDNVSLRYGWLNRSGVRTDPISTGESCVIYNQTTSHTQLPRGNGLTGFAAGTVFNNVKVAVMVFDLTQMFGAGNEPATPAEFWSYFDHKLYPYNAGETQPLFKISRKSLWAVAPKHYTARWDKVNAAMVRLNDAASFPTNITNFAHRGSVNANYSNPFDNIYPWSGIKLCNISIDLYRNLAAGDSITKCVTAWEGDANFSYNDANGVWRYRPEFWGKSWEDDTYRYFDVADKNVYDSSYVYYPEAIVGRWHGRNVSKTIDGSNKSCLIPSVGMPAKRIAVSALHTYAKNYGATIDSIFSIDADVLLCVVEFATMNTQNAIGNGVTSMYRQSSYLIQEDATNSTVVKVLASNGSGYCIPGAIFDIGTSDGGVQVGSYYIVSAQPNAGNAQYLDVTLNEAVTVTAANYWSVHGIINVADEEIGSKSGYIGTNGKCNSYYRGFVLFGNMYLYTLGAYENHEDQHVWIANSDEEADNYDALNTSVHYDTGLVLPGTSGRTKKLGMLSRSGLLSIPVFCTEIGGDSNNPTGDYFYNGVYAYNTVLIRGGYAYSGSSAGAFSGFWRTAASHSHWNCAARPRLKNP